MKLGSHHSEETKIKIGITSRGRIPSPEARAKMSAAHMGNTAHLGIPLSPETRAKLSASHKGRPFSKEHRENMSKGGPSESWRRSRAKRRTLGFIPLNAPFPGCAGHHIDPEQIIHIPEALHKSIYHNLHTGQGMAKINAVAYNYLFKQEVETAMLGRVT